MEKLDSGFSYGILAFLEGRPQNLSEIARSTGMSKLAVKRRVRKLEEAGFVIRRSDNKYQCAVILLPIKAEEAAKAHLSAPEQPKIEATEPQERKFSPEKSTASEQAKTIAKRANLPAQLGSGELSIGKGGKCVKCNKTTVFKYGDKAYCATCARKK